MGGGSVLRTDSSLGPGARSSQEAAGQRLLPGGPKLLPHLCPHCHTGTPPGHLQELTRSSSASPHPTELPAIRFLPWQPRT